MVSNTHSGAAKQYHCSLGSKDNRRNVTYIRHPELQVAFVVAIALVVPEAHGSSCQYCLTMRIFRGFIGRSCHPLAAAVAGSRV